MLYLDDVRNAVWNKWGLVILDWYFSKGMETHKARKKIKKQKFVKSDVTPTLQADDEMGTRMTTMTSGHKELLHSMIGCQGPPQGVF